MVSNFRVFCQRDISRVSILAVSKYDKLHIVLKIKIAGTVCRTFIFTAKNYTVTTLSFTFVFVTFVDIRRMDIVHMSKRQETTTPPG